MESDVDANDFILLGDAVKGDASRDKVLPDVGHQFRGGGGGDGGGGCGVDNQSDVGTEKNKNEEDQQHWLSMLGALWSNAGLRKDGAPRKF